MKSTAPPRPTPPFWIAPLLGLLLSCIALPTLASDPLPALLPAPARMQVLEGRYVPDASVRIVVSPRNAETRKLGELAAAILREHWNIDAKLVRDDTAELVLALEPDPDAHREAYRLRVDGDGIRLHASTTTGMFYGLQTLRQIAEQGDAKDGIAAVEIDDAPRFAWRGLHLDVGRHLYPLDFLKRQLELMARYKLNTFHWHLTEDQGWRLQIKRYPKLTGVGAWRRETSVPQPDGSLGGDGKRYGGFYTQAEARELVTYAKKLHIEVIPEIEMPGHTVAALAAYPELACTPGPFEVRTTWGVDDNVLCPSEQTFEFIENVLDEVLDIFPSRYIHVGGDEAPIVRWQESPLAQAIIRREGLADEHALQGWFVGRVERYLQSRGRRMIGWDEILAGDPLPSATVMAWRSAEWGAEAARRGHDVVMTPTSYAYFDYCQSRRSDEPYCSGDLPMRQVYAFEPVPEGLDSAQAVHILGGQGNVWTEYMPDERHVEYMTWPRALAMAEVLWSPRDSRDWNGFMHRLGPQLDVLDRLGVNYRIPEVEGLDGDFASLQPSAELILRSGLPGADIVYAVDGSEPDAQSPVYTQPVTLLLDGAVPVEVAARLRLADGRLGPISRARFRQLPLTPAVRAEGSLRAGLQRDYFEVWTERTDRLPELAPMRSDIADDIALPAHARPEGFGLRYRGWLLVPKGGLYRFSLTSDDGARLWIGNQLVVDRDGPQSPGRTVGNIGLRAGLHAFELRYFQGGGDRVLALEVETDGEPARPVPADWWRH
jgi:hexosaminidase